MCSEYTTKTNAKQIEKALKVEVNDNTKDFDWGKVIRFSTPAPVIELKDGKLSMSLRTFPVSPMPNARLSGIGNQTDGNDKDEVDQIQIRRIYEMPRWKNNFAKHPVLIPMSSFTEFAYWGDEKGTAQNFSLPEEDPLFAAGILMKPFVPKGEDGTAFSILTHTATEQMLKYHHRLVVILKAEDAFGYLEQQSVEARFDYLIKKRFIGSLSVEKLRDMAKAWTGRIKNQELKLLKEKKYREILKREGVEG